MKKVEEKPKGKDFERRDKDPSLKQKDPYKKDPKKVDVREKRSKDPSLCMNDPSWYVITPDLLKDVASIPFAEWMGRGLPLSGGSTTIRQVVMTKLNVVLSPGLCDDASDGFNLAVRNFYTFVRHANSGHANYEPADLGLYLFSVGSVVAYLVHIERLIGVAKCYQTKNVALPRDIFQGLGCADYANLVANLANYTARLNVLWVRLSSLCLPSGFKFIQRWIWMFSQVFKDHPSKKASLYAFVPAFGQFDAISAITGGSYKTNVGSTGWIKTINDYFVEAEAALDAILSDEDMNIMSGDILKACGADNLLKFGNTSLDYMVEPVYVEEMLPQIHNSFSLAAVVNANGYITPKLAQFVDHQTGVALGSNFLAIANLLDTDAQGGYLRYFQYDGMLYNKPCSVPGQNTFTTDTTDLHCGYFATTGQGGGGYMGVPKKRLLNLFSEIPTPEEVIVATRLANNPRVETVVANSKYTTIIGHGTELLFGYELIYSLWTGAVQTFATEYYSFSLNPGSTAFDQPIRDKQCWSLQADYAPIAYTSSLNDVKWNSESVISFVVGDFDNYTNITHEMLNIMHTNACVAEFFMGQMNFIIPK